MPLARRTDRRVSPFQGVWLESVSMPQLAQPLKPLCSRDIDLDEQLGSHIANIDEIGESCRCRDFISCSW